MIKKYCYINKALNTEFKYWAVDRRGNIFYLFEKNKLIKADELIEKNWFEEMLGRNLDPDKLVEFYYAYKQALSNAGYIYAIIDLVTPINITALKK